MNANADEDAARYSRASADIRGRRRFFVMRLGLLKSYILAAALVALVTVAALRMEPRLGPGNPSMLYLLAVVISALRWGRGAAIFSAIAGAFVCDYFFIPPLYSLAVVNVSSDVVTFAALLVVGLVISTLTVRVRDEADRARQREAATAALYSLSQELAATVDAPHIVEIIGKRAAETFACPVAVLLPAERGLRVSFRSPGFDPGPEQAMAAEAVFKSGEQPAVGSASFHPMKASGIAVGVLVVGPSLAPAQQPLLKAFASQAAVALERARLEQQARQAQLLEETGRLQRALLNSVSHNLRTPLASIHSALSSLKEDEALEESARRELLTTALQEAVRLNRLVGNLLDMTRLEQGGLQLRLAPCDVQDIIGAAIAQLGESARQRRILVEVAPDLPLVPADYVLVEQVLVNLLDNAIKYSPPAAPVRVRACVDGLALEISVADQGRGIPAEDAERVFQKFVRLENDRAPGGLGLGLSIARGFVAVHGGRIRIQPNSGGGTIVSFSLPLEQHKETQT